MPIANEAVRFRRPRARLLRIVVENARSGAPPPHVTVSIPSHQPIAQPTGTVRKGARTPGIAWMLVALVVSGCNMGSEKVTIGELSSPCPTEARVSAGSFRVKAPQINIRRGPGTEFDKMVDKPRSRRSGSTQYAMLKPGLTVLEECRHGSWSRIWVTEPKGLRATHHGWVYNRYLGSS